MKIRKLFLNLAGLFSISGSILSQIPTNGLVGFYPFNGNANDESGNHHNGSVHGAILAPDRCGYLDSAYYFPGNYEYIELPASEEFINSTYTYSLWMKVDAWPDPSIDGWMLFSPGSATSGLCQGIGIHPDGGICATSYNIGDNPRGSWAESSAIPAKRWNHVVVTRDYEKITIYINGILMPYVETDRYQPYTNNQEANYGAPDTRIIIGCRSNFMYPYTFQGYIDDLAIYNRVLTTDEIKKLFETTCRESPKDGLISYFPFDGNAVDATGNGNDGIIHGPVLTTDRCGNANSAYLFDGTDDYISLNPSYILPESEGTFATWVYFNSLNTVQYLGCLGDIESQDYYLGFIRFDPASQRFTIYRRSPGSVDILVGSTNITLHQWYFIVVTTDGNDWSLYVNGEKETLSLHLGTNTGDWGLDVPQADNWLLGGIRIQEPYDHAYLNGKLDDVRIYDYPLSRDEILSLYTNNCPIEIAGEQLFCQGQNNNLFSLPLIEDLVYIWSYSGTGALLSSYKNQVTIDFSDNATSGVLSVSAQRGNDTVNYSTLSISVLSLPADPANISGPADACLNDGPYSFTIPEIENAQDYTWEFSGEDAELIKESNTLNAYFFNNATSGSITVTGINQCGQGKTSQPHPVIVKDCNIPVVPTNIPNSFSPNGDNTNDLFVIQGLREGTSVTIFDSNGKTLYRTENYNNDWNGTDSDGNVLQTGTYWYVIKIPGLDNVLKGFVYIKR
jgi:gliding motility-associated-like protein